MNEKPQPKEVKDQEAFCQKIGTDAERKLKAQRNKNTGIWSGLGMMGLIGWSVVLPTLAGAAVGLWLDESYTGSISWTLTLLIVGMAAGCLNAWRLLSREGREISEKEKEQEGKDKDA